MYSNKSSLFSVFEKGFILSIPFSVIMTTSPGSISLTKSAPIISKAHVSEHKIYEPSKFPKTRGLIPKGSLAPINFLLVNITKA